MIALVLTLVLHMPLNINSAMNHTVIYGVLRRKHALELPIKRKRSNRRKGQR